MWQEKHNKCWACSTHESLFSLSLSQEAKLPEKTVEKPKPKKQKATKSAKKAKEETTNVVDTKEISKKGIAEYKAIKKAFKQKPTGIEMGDKVKKAAIKKIFPSGMESRLLTSTRSTNVHKFLEASYDAIVLISNNGWRRADWLDQPHLSPGLRDQ